MKVRETNLPGVLLVEPQVFADARGYFFEGFHQAKFKQAGIDVAFVQSNISRSTRGVLRGLHYQWPQPQGKLVNVLEGEVYDVAVDIRVGSPTFGQWTAAVLSAENHRCLWIPEGFAHGFCAVSATATLAYQCTALYAPAADASLRWNDARLAVDWPVSAPLLSDKDARAPLLDEILADRLPVFTP